jgi:hypothetical protein
MSNPSLVWAQLSIPNPPIGSIPFVDIDNATILTDTLNFYYTAANWNLAFGLNQKTLQLTVTNGVRVAYTDLSGTPGNAIINKPAGLTKIAAGQTTITVTNNLVSPNSIIKCGIQGGFDTTAKNVQAAPGNGSFNLTLGAAATADVVVWFDVLNVF